MQLQQSPVEKITFRGHTFYIKRDDLLHPAFSGNKARKFYYFLHNDFPATAKIISYGSPQANSLYSLSVLSRLKQWSLDYYVDHIPSFVRHKADGNYQAAIENGAKIIALNRSDMALPVLDYIQQMILPIENHALFIPEGGRCKEAEPGLKILSDEINQWADKDNIQKLNVFLPSGTGTTALFLQKNSRFRVLTCACVGGEHYLKQQLDLLSPLKSDHPVILSACKKFHFGKLYEAFYAIWQALKNDTGIEFDLLYDPLGWLILMDYIENTKDKTPVLYIHQGGLLGNKTMLPRYLRKLRINKSS
jgi:1-aminocyclopropane-1-carboxylate deaminase